MQIKVLGPLEVSVSGAPIAVGGRRSRTALCWLALHANRPVSFRDLASAVWGSRRTADVAKSRAVVRSLQSLLPPHTVRTGESATLAASAEMIDATLFVRDLEMATRMFADGNRDVARANLTRGLRRWRDDQPYPELQHCVDALPAIQQLRERRLDAMELRQEIALADGIDFAAAADLRYLVALYPERRAFRLQLARALFVTGRQVEALQALRDAVEVLGDDEQTRALGALIARRDPAAARLSTVTVPARVG